MSTLYFAYGSNMSTEQMFKRIKSAKVIGPAYLEDKKVLFNKLSNDGSGKANIVDSPGNVTWGVLYEIKDQDLNILDGYEGGYDRVVLKVCRSHGKMVEAVTYISGKLTEEPVAYDDYKAKVISGAREHNLPQDHISYLEQLPSKSNT